MIRYTSIKLLLPAFLAAASCQSSTPEVKTEDRENISYRIVETKKFQLPVRASGMLSSKTQSNLSFITGGIIRKINIPVGSDVKKGQVIAELDLTEIESRVKQASLALDKAVRDHNRLENLYTDSVATLENLQDIKTALEIARTNLKIAQFNRDFSKITAPANGKILKRLKEINEITAPGHPVFVFASTESDWILKTTLSDRDVVRIHKGDSAKIRFDAYPGIEFSAEVLEIADAANLLNGTFEAELKLKELPERLVTGLIGSATIFPREHSHPFIPYISLAEASGLKAWVYCIENGAPVRREVLIFAITDEGVYIKEGIQEGDTVVTEGTAYLR